MVVLSGTTPNIRTAYPAKHLTASLEGSLVNLAIILDDTNQNSVLVGELGDVLGALFPPHDGAMVLEGLHKHHGSGRGQ